VFESRVLKNMLRPERVIARGGWGQVQIEERPKYRMGHKSLKKNAFKSQIYVKRFMAHPVYWCDSINWPLLAQNGSM
jgi:hypothetical protein